MFTNRRKPSFFGALFFGLTAAGLLLGTGVASADDKPAEEAKGIVWVDGWAAGQAKAKEAGKLIFLYFGRHAPQ